MDHRRRLAVLLAVTSILSGCAGPDDGASLGSSVARFTAAGPDVTCDFELRGASAVPGGDHLASLVVDLGGCKVIETDDGRSRLAYPAGPVATPATRPTLVITFAEAGRWDGSLDLTPTPRPIETPRSTGDAWRDAVVAVFTMPGFLAQPFVGLPDRLAANLDGPGPVAPAVLDLARDLVEYRGIAAIGTVRNTGVLACRLTTTDAGRAKLSAALARRSSATPRPS